MQKKILIILTVLTCVINSNVYAKCEDPAGPGVNWANCSKQGISLPENTDLSGANLTGTNFSGNTTNLNKVNFSNAKLIGTNFAYSNLEGAEFNFATMQKTIFTGANLKQAIFISTTESFTVSTAFFDNAQLNGALFSRIAFANPTSFKNAKFSYYIDGNTKKPTVFDDVAFDDASNSLVLANPDMSGLVLRDIILNSKFVNKDIFKNKNLTEAKFENLQGRQAIVGMNFAGTNLESASFTNSIINSCDFSNSILIRTNFAEAKIDHGEEYKYGIANTIYSSFIGSDVLGANFSATQFNSRTTFCKNTNNLDKIIKTIFVRFPKDCIGLIE